jgi:YegS C-terminal NAD kinase beta sandwich-like domain
VTIRKGEPWGSTGPAPDDLLRVYTDGELGRLVAECRTAGEPVPPVALLGGDLMRAVGGTGRADRLDGEMAILPVDVIRVEAEGDSAWFVGHLLARHSWWRGPIWAAVNGQYIGDSDVSPRAHPNDGRVDLVRVDASMTIRDRWRASQRLVHGTHVPHPAIEIRQVSTADVDLGRPTWITLDAVHWRKASAFTLTVEPDALVVHV